MNLLTSVMKWTPHPSNTIDLIYLRMRTNMAASMRLAKILTERTRLDLTAFLHLDACLIAHMTHFNLQYHHNAEIDWRLFLWYEQHLSTTNNWKVWTSTDTDWHT